MKKLTSILSSLCLFFSATQSFAHAPGDLMIVGYKSDLAPADSISFVTWVELAVNESIILIDSDYSGDGDGTGQELTGGEWNSVRTITWTNGASAIAPGTVIVIPNVQASTPTANIGTCVRSGNFGLTNNGEQIFIGQGSFVTSGGKDFFDGDLIFGLDYEGNGGWGESGESKLPSVLNVANGNINLGAKDDYEVKNSARNGKPLVDYKADVLNLGNWEIPASGGTLLSTAFVADNTNAGGGSGAVSSGLLFHSRRMNHKMPILDEAWSIAQGATGSNIENLNGSSCIRIPDWITPAKRADPTAVYYLYFADHSGNYIRMAWAASIEGPWTGFRMDESIYTSIGDRGVLSLGDDDEINAGDGVFIDGHIASPDILIDDVKQRIIMYFHGQVSFGSVGTNRSQRTVAAISSDGLNFNMPTGGDSRAGQSGTSGYGSPDVGFGVLPVNYGESYFRIFEEGGRQYALTNTGDIYGAPVDNTNVPLDPLVPDNSYNHTSRHWDQGPKPFTDETESRGWLDWGGGNGALRPRHFGVLKRDGILYAFFTNKGQIDERVKISTYDFAKLPSVSELSFESWKGTFPNQELIRPEENWEGGNLALNISGAGGSDDPVRQLRDPSVMEDSDGRTYLFYSGRGEKAIGLAQLVSLPQVSGSTEVATGEDHTFMVNTDVDVTPSMLKISRSEAVDVDYDAEEASLEFTYAGNSYNPVQSSTVGQGSSSYQLAHSATGESVTLTFPERYYAKSGATFGFASRLRASTTGQFAEVQVSFDGTQWQTVWIQRGGTSDGSFSMKSIDISGLVGRTFEMRFRYQHVPLRNASITSGNGSGTGWFIDEIVATGLEVVTTVSEAAFTSSSFTLDDISGVINPVIVTDDGKDDRFLFSVSGLHSGTGFSETIGYGKPYVILVKKGYEGFLDEYFTQTEQANPLISGEGADPDEDGISNLHEHAYGTDPTEKNGNQVTFALTGNPAKPTLTFPWNPDAEYSYTLQLGNLVTSFADIAHTESSVTVGGKLMISLQPHLSVTVPSDRAFFRLKIE